MDNNLDSHAIAYRGNLHDFDNNIQLNWYPQRILKATEGAASLLELGLGHGITTNLFSSYFKKHIVLDASPEVIEDFKNNYIGCKAQIIETYFEEFKSNDKFDVIVFGFILEHVDRPIETLRYIKQFLSPKGKAFISVPNAEVMNRKLGNLMGILPDMKLLSEHDLMCGHQRYYTVESLTKDIQEAGYCLKRMEGIFLKPFTTKQLISLDLSSSVINALCQMGIEYPELCCGLLAEIGDYEDVKME